MAISCGKGKAAIANHLHDHADHVFVRQQSQQLAGEAAVPCGVVGCCEVDKHSSGLLFSWNAILDVLCQQGDLIYGRPPVSEDRLLLREQWVGDCFDRNVDESLEDFKGDTQQRYSLFGWTALNILGMNFKPFSNKVVTTTEDYHSTVMVTAVTHTSESCRNIFAQENSFRVFNTSSVLAKNWRCVKYMKIIFE